MTTSNAIACEVALRDFARSIGVDPAGGPEAVIAEVQRRVQDKWGPTARFCLQSCMAGWDRLVVEDGDAIEGDEPRLFWEGEKIRWMP